MAVARELTKVHEEVWRGSLGDAVTWAEERPVRGEVVLVVEGATSMPDEVADDVLGAVIGERLRAGERLRGVVDDVAAAFDVPRRRVYQLALGEQDRGDGSPTTVGGEGR